MHKQGASCGLQGSRKMLEDPTTIQRLIKARIERNHSRTQWQRRVPEADGHTDKGKRLLPLFADWKHRFLSRIIRH